MKILRQKSRKKWAGNFLGRVLISESPLFQTRPTAIIKKFEQVFFLFFSFFLIILNPGAAGPIIKPSLITNDFGGIQ